MVLLDTEAPGTSSENFSEDADDGTISLQSFSVVDCLGQVLQRDYKNTMMTSFHDFGIRNFHVL